MVSNAEIYEALNVSGYGVLLIGLGGASKIELIKIIRHHTGMYLKESKTLVDKAARECVWLVWNMPEPDADSFVSQLRVAGADAAVGLPGDYREVRPTPAP